MSGSDLEIALRELFQAYDLDESGELTREEFLAIEMRLAASAGEVYMAESGSAKLTKADKDGSGILDFEEFRDRFLETYQMMGMDTKSSIKHMQSQTKQILTERASMGARYHAGIRTVLRQIFNLFDASGDGSLSPEEWIAAQKTVAVEVSDDLDEAWIDEAAFKAADNNGDGVLDEGEFLEASFSMFEGVKRPSHVILSVLQRVVKVLESKQKAGRTETEAVKIFVQALAKPEFQTPQEAIKDEARADGTENVDPNAPDDKWKEAAQVKLPTNLSTAEEVAGLVRMKLGMPPDSWISVYFLGPQKDGGLRPVVLLRGERPGEGNVQNMLSYLCKPNADCSIFVKNQRKRPAKLLKQPRAFLEERDSLLAKRVGMCWGLDWETQLVGEGESLPPRPPLWTIMLGDALVVEVPVECGLDLDRYVCGVYMDGVSVLSKPIDENVVAVAKKKKKKSAGEAPPLLQLTFVSLKEGKCVLFVDLSWEDQEEKLALGNKLMKPTNENSVARIGPIEVEVVKATAKQDKNAFQWWNGEKWSNKKGPAKRKKGKKK